MPLQVDPSFSQNEKKLGRKFSCDVNRISRPGQFEKLGERVGYSSFIPLAGMRRRPKSAVRGQKNNDLERKTSP
jgi:hypothetical protein